MSKIEYHISSPLDVERLLNKELGISGRISNIGLLCVACVTIASLSYEDKLAETLTIEKLKEYAGYLASDELDGRLSGTEGEIKATDFIAKLFAEAGLAPYGDRLDSGEKSYFQYFDLKKKGGQRGRNCIGLLEGTDPTLKNQHIVIGAHHDHIGNARKDPNVYGRLNKPTDDDCIYNGANDNASGTSTLLAVASALKAAGIKFKRSILFITFSGEEMGLKGSKYYVEHPAIPLENCVFMINLDSVGGSNDDFISIIELGAHKGDYIKNLIENIRNLVDSEIITQEMGILGGDSDHSSFRKKSIPAIFLNSGRKGRQMPTELKQTYHRTNDHADTLNYERMQAVGLFIIRFLDQLANNKQVPQFDETYPERFAKYAASEGLKGRKALGIMPDTDISEEERQQLSLEDGQGVVLISEVVKNSIAEKYGLKKGDIIIEFDGKTFSKDNCYTEIRRYIKECKDTTPIQIKLSRDANIIELEVIFEKQEERKEQK